HYVKMVHNGIEYGDMQLICEAYNIMKNGLGLGADEMHNVFAEWNQGDLDSYLIEITRDILAKKDEDGQPLVDKILDTAGQKGTGKWTVISSQELGIPITLMAEAVYSRCVSALKDDRGNAAGINGFRHQGDRNAEFLRRNDGPFAGAFLTGGVEDFVHERLAVLVFFGENVAGNFDQI